MIILDKKYNSTFSKQNMTLEDVRNTELLEELKDKLNNLNQNYKQKLSFEMIIGNRLYQCHANYIIKKYVDGVWYFSTRRILDTNFYLVKKSPYYYIISLLNNFRR